jgi:polyhydroxyalkanoate synthase
MKITGLPSESADTTHPPAPGLARRALGLAKGMLAPLTGTLAAADPLSLGEALTRVAVSVASNPDRAVGAGGRYVGGLVHAGIATAARLVRIKPEGPVTPEVGDKRFTDEAWQDSPYFFWLMEAFLLRRRLVEDLLLAADSVDALSRAKGEFAARLMVDALAPSNYLWGNPVALRKAWETRGKSVVRSLRNWADDRLHNGGYPRQVSPGAFAVGVELAVTPGKVVFRTPLFELIEYRPQTDTVYEIPILCSAPWINKYYVMDLAPKRSFIEWAVQHGHTVFCISYKNPDAAMRDISMEDYLSGIKSAVDAVLSITGAPKLNLVALCLGGLLASILMAHFAALGESKIHTATLLNTLTDYTNPGPLGIFTDRRTVDRLAVRMKKTGFLSATDMARTFDLLRPHDLVWNYVTNNWLLGEDPPAFDILSWNADSTRMPATMHENYLRSCYISNALARGEMTLGGTRLCLADVKNDVYVLSAKEDHIAPWRSSYLATQLFGGQTRFVLSSAGHIAGIVNPPGPKSVHWTNEKISPTPDAWFSGAVKNQGTWWEDWTRWIAARSGERRTPPPLGNATYAALYDAPGKYVLEK